MDKEKRQDRIDDYLLGNGAPEERREFEEETTRNKDLSNELGATELAIAAIELAEDRALKARLQGLEQKLAAKTSASTVVPPLTATSSRKPEARVVDIGRRRKGRLRLLGYAAALLLMLAVGWWAFSEPGGFDAQQLAMDSFKPYENIATGTVRGDNDATAETAAFADYDAGNYAAAADKFAALPESNVHQFYLGQSLLAQGDFEEAHLIFLKLWRSDFALKEESYYYLGLADLGRGDIIEARNALSKIARNENHPMQAEAKALLAKM